MLLSRVDIRNFRCFRDFTLFPRKSINLILGENNSGKTALLDALDNALGRGFPSFELEDLHLDSPHEDPRKVLPIQIDLRFEPDPGQTFSAAFATDFVDEVDLDPVTGDPFLWYRLEGAFDQQLDRIQVSYFVLKSNGSTLALNARKRARLRSYKPFYMADAFRDTIREIGNRRSFWGRTLSAVGFDPAVISQIQGTLARANVDLLAASSDLRDIETRLKEIGRIISLEPGGSEVELRPVSTEPQELLRNLDVLIRVWGSPRAFSLQRHGEGTRSIAYLTIFRMFVDRLAKVENENEEADPLLGIEEPEVHLHPHSEKAVIKELMSLSGQSFITTHSVAVAEEAPPSLITMLRRSGNSISPCAIPSQDPASPGKPYLDVGDTDLLMRQLRTGGAEILFSRCAVLCEGDTESGALPVFARALGVDLNLMGISVFSVGGTGYRPLLRSLHTNAFRVPWVLLSDAEKETLQKISKFLAQAGYVTEKEVRDAEGKGQLIEEILAPNNCFTYPPGQNFEQAIFAAGGKASYQKIGKTYGGASKPLLGRLVAEEITSGGTDPSKIPPAIVKSLRCAEQLSRER